MAFFAYCLAISIFLGIIIGFLCPIEKTLCLKEYGQQENWLFMVREKHSSADECFFILRFKIPCRILTTGSRIVV
jgi:hypothetical protein